MIGLLVAERRKLTSVRTIWVLTLIGWAFVVLTAAAVLTRDRRGADVGGAPHLAEIIDGVGSNALFVVLVVGLLAMTTEFRHQTVGRTLAVTPSRVRVLVAKFVAAAAYVVAFMLGALVCIAATGAVLRLVGPAGGPGLEVTAEVAATLGRTTASLGLVALLGVALGALLRSQVVAITLSLAWIFVLETLMAIQFPDLGPWLPFQALQAVFATSDVMTGPFELLEPLAGLATFLGYVVATSTAALVLLTRRDV